VRDAVVHFEGVWKKFRRGERHDSLRDLIPALARSLTGRRAADELGRQEFWAVEDVSFDVRPGQALGIIGPNGAGKSTVLKILTRLIRPTHGRALVRGRVGSLLEIGGSLHPDLTGRENVYLQGAIMGMRRAEITGKFDEIVAFSEIPEFIDTPVKRYSSGMHARLGFAVAAHLETDVLIIDEVLAVGDTAFQRKAFARMEEMVARGVPTVIVSHQLERIATLCTEAILLTKGRVAFRGEPADALAAYARHQSRTAPETAQDGTVHLESIAVTSPQPVLSGEPLTVAIWGSAPPDDGVHPRAVVVRVRSLETGHLIYATNNRARGLELPVGAFELTVELEMNVPQGMYSLESLVGTGTRDRDVRNGPATLVHVKGGPTFSGSVQLGGAMRVESRRETGPDGAT
jgi:ABC-type polysaccharide/polyol phosphate transport system ATPase subunit